MAAERLLTWLLGRDAGARDGAMRALLAALWSFLQHPADTLEDHFSALEGRLGVLEARLVRDAKTVVDTGVEAVEEAVAGGEHRLEEELKRAIGGRIAGIQARLEGVRNRAVENLRRELRRVVLILALATCCGVLALAAMTFGLMAAWADLEGLIGGAGASLVLAMSFLLASLVVYGLLRSVRRRPHPAPGARSIAT
jgi:hypothetical protein